MGKNLWLLWFQFFRAKSDKTPRNVNSTLPRTFELFKNELLKERLEISQWVAPPDHVEIFIS